MRSFKSATRFSVLEKKILRLRKCLKSTEIPSAVKVFAKSNDFSFLSSCFQPSSRKKSETASSVDLADELSELVANVTKSSK